MTGAPAIQKPGLEPAPQSAQAAPADAAVVDWFCQHLTGLMP